MKTAVRQEYQSQTQRVKREKQYTRVQQKRQRVGKRLIVVYTFYKRLKNSNDLIGEGIIKICFHFLMGAKFVIGCMTAQHSVLNEHPIGKLVDIKGARKGSIHQEE